MSSSDEEFEREFTSGGDIYDFLDHGNSQNLDSQNQFTPLRVQRPADYSTPAQPQRQMRIQFSTLHTRPSSIRPEQPPQASTSPMPVTPIVRQELSSPAASDSPFQEHAPTHHQDQRISPPKVDSVINDGSFIGSQHADEASDTVITSIESSKVKNEKSKCTIDHGRGQTASEDVYDASPRIFSCAPPQQPGRQRPSIFGTPRNSCAYSARTSKYLQTSQPSRQQVEPEAIIVNSDSDNDCVIIQVREVRRGERRMFSMQSQRTLVKNEPTPDRQTSLSAPEVSNDSFHGTNVSSNRGMAFDGDCQLSLTDEEMLAAQEAIIPPAHSDGVESSRPPLNESRKRRRESIASSDHQLEIDTAEIDTAMQVNEDDDEWMHAQGGDDDGSQEEYENLLTIQNTLNEDINRKGDISLDERAELIRVSNTLSRMDRLKAAQAKGVEDEEDEETLFIPETHRRSPIVVDNGEGPSTRRKNGYKDVDDDAGLASMLQEEFDRDVDDGYSTKLKSKKPRRAPAKNAREFFEREKERRFEKERDKSQKKRATGGKGRRAEKVKASRKGKGKEREKKSKKGSVKVDRGINEIRFMRSRGGQQDEIGQLILDDLMNCDPSAIGSRIQSSTLDLSQKLMAQPEPKPPNCNSCLPTFLKASRSFGYAQVKAVNGKWLVKGMKSTLYHHQLIGAQWMVSRELSSEPPHGGLLADSMGLGKTVQTLACMVGNPPTNEDRKRGVTATLIVVPSSVINQWLEEIQIHVDCKSGFRKVMQYKASMHIPCAVLKDFRHCSYFVHRSYEAVSLPDRKGREDIARFGYKKWWKMAHDDLGDLHRINWRRVILDEAHAIKNNSARTSLACQNLKSVYRWCLTGTPLLNRLEELFPYLRFLKANYSMDWKTFQQYFCDPDADDCTNRIATLLSYAMMRRTMKTTILNRPIIILPEPHPVMQQINFSREERIIYRITENRFRANLNVFLAKGTAQRAYGVFFVQLLRLRQCTSHPFMLERTMKESWTTEDVELLRGELKRQGVSRIPFYEQCKLWVAQSEEGRAAAKARGEEGAEAILLGSLNLPIITTCKHIFCRSCLTNHLHSQMILSDGDDTYNVCPKCDIIFSSAEPYRDLEIPDDENMDSGPNQTQESETSARGSNKRQKSSNDGSRRPRGIRSKGIDALDFEPFTKDNTWVTKSDYDPDFPLIPSAKTTALKALLLKAFQEAPDDKVVIYVQFRTLARIIGRMCTAEGWGFLYLTGDASLDHRNKAI
ncbi:hypothetical protein DID88_005359 [Monilinia fructigena]|uniref:Helicase ATP-binding domain-containing protein n=1 Tax=Monilinia fructigena TaxID=38457 RepID=A0A395IZU8_9HELO|nr:hypothetical protein DID88_005359 [Monilinia fructigena]